jgi:hypothetical protein
MTELRYKSGGIVFSEGEESNLVYRVLEGEAEVLKVNEGQEVVLGSVTRGDFVGEMGVLVGRPRSATVRATRGLVVEVIRREDFLAHISRDNVAALRLLARMAERLRASNAAFTEITTAGSATEFPPGFATKAVAGPERLRILADSPRLGAHLPSDGLVVDHLPFAIGRTPNDREHAPSVNIALPLDESPPYRLSRAHFCLEQQDEGICVRDLGSKLGTRVNGVAIGLDFDRDVEPLGQGENSVIAGGANSGFAFRVIVAS